MEASLPATSDAQVSLHPVDQNNWRDVARLKVFENQREFVAEPSAYLALCCYGQDWQPLAICLGDQVIGFMMWSTDPADGSCWLGGIFIDRDMQRRGYGRKAVLAAIEMLRSRHGYHVPSSPSFFQRILTCKFPEEQPMHYQSYILQSKFVF